MGDGPNDAGLSRHHLIAACEASLQAAGHRLDRPLPAARMGRPDPARGDAGGARRPRPQRQGPLCRLLQLLRLAADEGARRSASAQRPGALRQPADPLHAARRARPSTSWCRSPSTRGSASWSGARSPAACCPASTAAASRTRRARATSTDWAEPPIRDEDRLYDIVEVLVEIADERGVSAAQVALAWLLGRPGVSSLVDRRAHRGAARRQFAAAELELTGDERARLDEVSAPPSLSLLAPGQDRQDRLSAADLTLLGPHL